MCGHKLPLVTARHVKNVSGRNSAVLDLPMAAVAYAPQTAQRCVSPAVCVLRALWGQQSMLLKSQTRRVQRMQETHTPIEAQLASSFRT